MDEGPITLKPVYEFEWSDGSARKTDNLVNGNKIGEEGIEFLAQLGREDPECVRVDLVGYESL